jgi:ribosomal protein S18 acetylase RimI-like enzyme
MPARRQPEGARSPDARRVITPRRHIREVRTAADPHFAAAYALLRRTFPKSELMPKRDWSTVMAEREAGLFTDINWHLLVALRGDTLIGAASGSYLGNVNVGVIGYIAVDPGAREAGLGPLLRRHLRRAFERDALRIRGRPLRAIVGEVEADNRWLRTLVRRHDALALDFPYYQPSLRDDEHAVPLVMYWQPIASRHTSSLGVPALRRLLYTIWRRTFRVRAPLREPAFRRMMAALKGRRRIGAAPLAPGR